MSHADVTLFFEKKRLDAVRRALAENNVTVEEELSKSFQFLYEQLVPIEQQTIIESDIRERDRIEQEAAEARRRFGVYHVRENGEDRYFTSDHFISFPLAAYRYRLYCRGELSDQPRCFADSFWETRSLSENEYKDLCGSMEDDHRIKVLLDFDLDAGTVSTCDRLHPAWRTYPLHDVSVAAYHAQRSLYHPTDERLEIFENALAGKELTDESESAQIQSM